MNRVLSCLFAGAIALPLISGAAWSQDEAPAAESKPAPLADIDPAEYVDLLAEGKDGNVLGVVFDVVLNDSGKATTVVVELFEEEAEGEGEAEEAPVDEAEPDAVTEDTETDEAEPLPEEGAEEGTEEPVMVGKLVGVSPKGGMMDAGRDVVTLPSMTVDNVQNMEEFSYKPGMKSVGHPDGYPAE